MHLKIQVLLPLISITIFSSCYSNNLLLKEPMGSKDFLEVRYRHKKDSKSVIGTFSERDKAAFTSLSITNYSCDSFFLTKQQPEPLSLKPNKSVSTSTIYLIVFDDSGSITASEKEVVLFNKVFENSKSHLGCSIVPKDLSQYRIVRIVWKKRL